MIPTMNDSYSIIHVTYLFRFSPPQVLEQELGKANRMPEVDTDMVHKPDKDKEKEQDMVHKPVPGMVMDKVPDMGKVMDKDMVRGLAHTLDMVPGREKAFELAPAPARSRYIPLTADRNTAFH